MSGTRRDLAEGREAEHWGWSGMGRRGRTAYVPRVATMHLSFGRRKDSWRELRVTAEAWLGDRRPRHAIVRDGASAKPLFE